MVETNSIFEEFARREGIYSKELMEEIAKKGSVKNIVDASERIRSIFVTALDIDLEWHVRMQAAFQRHVDNAVSKTINLPNSATIDDVKRAYMLTYKLDCKGITIYRDGSRDAQVLERREKAVTPREYIKPRGRPEKTQGVTYEMQTGCGSLYITINEDDIGSPFEIFARLGKAGGCASAQTEGLGRSSSIILRSGIDPYEIVKHYKGIVCDRQYGVGKNKILSCPDAIGNALEKYLIEKKNASERNLTLESSSGESAARDTGVRNPIIIINGACPECGSPVIRVEGCRKCISNCGYSECY